MATTSLEELNLSNRAKNALHRMGIHCVEELAESSINDIAQQRSIGAKTLAEIKIVFEKVVSSTKETDDSEKRAFLNFDKQLIEMSYHYIDELNLSTRSYNALRRSAYSTIDKVAQLNDADYARMRNLGGKSVDEIKKSIDRWFWKNGISQDDINHNLSNRIVQKTTTALEPILHIHWKQLLDYVNEEGLAERAKNESFEKFLMEVLQLPQLKNRITAFWETTFPQGIIYPIELSANLRKLDLTFDANLLVDAALASNILAVYRNAYIFPRDTFIDHLYKNSDSDNKTVQVLQFRVEGETLQDIAALFELTRERVRQITVKAVRRMPLFFEDYFKEPFQCFWFQKREFIRAFPEVSEEGYEYLSIKYPHGKIALTGETIKTYNGPWRRRLLDFLDEEKESNDRNTIKKSEMIMRVLIGNSDKSLSIKEFEDEYYRYIDEKGHPRNRLKININSAVNHLRTARCIVFNCENKVRYCDANPRSVWDGIDFAQYKNTVISSELIYRDYRDLMDELDIRDGYELFYLIKASLAMWDSHEFAIRCRRVPVLIIGEASEKDQAVKLLKEISPVSYFDYYKAYEEKFGVRAQGNLTINNAVAAYYAEGHYRIDVPAIDDRDVQPLLKALREKSIWFIEDIENLFDCICSYTARDAINAAAFRRIGYILNTTYAYSASYGTALNLLDKTVFTKDVVALKTLDRRITNLGIFGSVLGKKKKSLEYVETAPKVYMSLEKIGEIYQLTLEEIKQVQSAMSPYYNIPFFNGRSIWSEVEGFPIIRKLQKNDWLLTCIMRQQENIYSLPVAGGIILSLDNASLSLARICEWLSSLHGVMPLADLKKIFNDTFGTRVSASRIAEKLRSSGLWDKVVTDSIDEYTDSLMCTGLYDVEAEERFELQ